MVCEDVAAMGGRVIFDSRLANNVIEEENAGRASRAALDLASIGGGSGGDGA